uniref:Gag1-like clamp domain-containing protein n=1 Tax=Physcomitrium patens TaxID=3218 RepID=A0A2K1IH84_PHYPA|nr:hypothetical protein PHYPA_029232 [Physcomitrium patens]
MRAFMPAEADAPSIQALQSERDVLQGSLFFLSFSRGLYSAPCSSEPAAAQPLTILFRCALFQLLLSVQTLLFVLHSPKLHFPAISSGAQVGSINSPGGGVLSQDGSLGVLLWFCGGFVAVGSFRVYLAGDLESRAGIVNPAAQDTCTASNTAYSNHALALWNQQRSAWVGTQPRPPARREPREPAISWNTTYEELLSTSRPFAQPIPLLEMVDFLVDVWEQEGLYERR